jgi:hypothetical protein
MRKDMRKGDALNGDGKRCYTHIIKMFGNEEVKGTIIFSTKRLINKQVAYKRNNTLH